MTVLNVFTDSSGNYGNPVGIISDTENKIASFARQQIAQESGFSEVVFINSFTRPDVSIFTPLRKIPFAGHALVGAAYFIKQKLKKPFREIKSSGFDVSVRFENNLSWVGGNLGVLPKWNLQQLINAKEVNKMKLQNSLNLVHTVVWAWLDEERGIIRARTFASDWGIPEDEANGSGSMILSSLLKREIVVHHGKGSIIHARSARSQFAEVGGLVKIGTN